MSSSLLKQHDALWVFAYGSLIWNPGFEVAERRVARLDGYRRRFALTSRHYRGTPENPGLVLGLDWAPGQSCMGIALRAEPGSEDTVRHYLADRELVSYAYFETVYPVTLICEGPGQGQNRDALCYVVDRVHSQYAGNLSREQKARIIAGAIGPSGPNTEYLQNTLQMLRQNGIVDAELEELSEMVAQCRQ